LIVAPGEARGASPGYDVVEQSHRAPQGVTENAQSPLTGLFLSIASFPTAHIWPLRDQMFHRGLCSLAAPQL